MIPPGAGRQGFPGGPGLVLAVAGRLARWLRHHLLGVFAVLGVIAFTLGLIGMYRLFKATPASFSWPNVVYFTATLFLLDGNVFQDGGQFPLTLEIARFLAPLATAVGVADAVSTVFAQRFERFRARRARHHVVVCGTGPTASALVDRLSQTKRVVLVAEDAQREYPDAERPAGLLRVVGDPVEPLVLAKAGIARADVVYGCLPDTSSNLAIALAARRLAVDRAEQPLRCLAQVGDLSLIPHLRARRIGLDDDAGFRLDFFAIEVLGAHALLNRHPPSWATVEADGAPPDQPAPLVVLGLSGLGRALVMELARRWRACAGADGALLPIAVSDPSAAAKLALLRAREPALSRVLLTGHDTQNGELPPDVLDATDRLGPPEFVYVCLGDEERALLFGLDAAQVLNERFGIGRTTVIVRTGRQRSLQDVFGQPNTTVAPTPTPLLENLRGGVRFFAVNDEALPLDLGDTDLIERFAQASHIRYLETERRRGQAMGSRRAMVPWDELPEDLRDANRAQAAQFGEMLRTQSLMLMPAGEADSDFSFTGAEIEQLAQQEHDRWRRERTAKGFTLGPAPQDGSGRRHPAMVDWAELPEVDRERDRDVIRALPGILAHAGLRIVPLNRPS
ncbi:NAD-binding protein [Frankia sp. AgKG'84/4]|uniref:NAD-binding protein n=1 Tax=Frankia sp. AgKG'84/4 TaxID=573490 RepID=UPI0020103769|nr:NAD-binding protein [Frankia sp. AgKG'84/4]MCL9795227.1 NAD-binding protein [Frankia sp. AgKG'84/4]